MAAVEFRITASARKQKGKAASRRMRRKEDLVPGIVYGAHKEPQMITVSHTELYLALQNEAMFSRILTLKLDATEEKVVLKNIHRHPARPKILHIDLLRIDPKEKIIMSIPLHFMGEKDAPGIKEEGILSKSIVEVEIRCLPSNLPEYIAVNVAHLAMDEALHLSDIKLPEGVELTTHVDEDHNPIVVAIHKPHEEIIEDAAPAAIPMEGDEAATAEGEDATAAPKAESKEGSEKK